MQKTLRADSREELEAIGGKWIASQARGHFQQDARIDQLKVQADREIGGYGMQITETDLIIEQQSPDIHSSLFRIFQDHQPADHSAQVQRGGESHPQEGTVRWVCPIRTAQNHFQVEQHAQG